jgi:hypothetical protein
MNINIFGGGKKGPKETGRIGDLADVHRAALNTLRASVAGILADDESRAALAMTDPKKDDGLGFA